MRGSCTIHVCTLLVLQASMYMLLCLVVCLTLLASFFLPSHLIKKKEASKVKKTTRQSNTAHPNVQYHNDACCFPPQTLPVKRPDFSQLRARLEVQLDSGWSSLPAGQRDSLSVQHHPPHVQPQRLSFHQHTPHLILHTLSARETAV